MERLKFAAIFTSNLDEFFMIRVAGLHDQVDAGLANTGADGRTPAETIDAIRERAAELERSPGGCVGVVAAPRAGGARDRGRRLGRARRGAAPALCERFRRQIFPVLTPLAVGLGRPFPYISNLSLSLAVLVRDPVTQHTTFARVKVPKEMLPRFVALDDDELTFVSLEEVIAANLDALFPGMEILDTGMFRVTRDADFEVSDEADDLLQAVETEVRRRRFGEVVRVEINAGMNPQLREEIVAALEVEERQVYDVDGPDRPDRPVADREAARLRRAARPAWAPVTQPRLQAEEGEKADIFAVMRDGDVLVHHPYDSFVDVGRALRRAGGQRPRRPGDQADGLPDLRGVAARARR